MKNKNRTRKFKKGMIFSIAIMPGESADSGDCMVIDTAKLGNSEDEKKWLKAIKEGFEQDLPENDEKMGIKRGQQTFPWDWEPLAKAEVEEFPVTIDGDLTLFYEVDED